MAPHLHVFVVFDLEAGEQPVPIGTYLATIEDIIQYRTPSGEVNSAPADCVQIVDVDLVYRNPELPDFAHSTIMAALLHYGLTCYDGSHCISALREMNMNQAADALTDALENKRPAPITHRACDDDAFWRSVGNAAD